ncbi:MAG: BACON domain-containing protein [Alistipes sp.]|nr:BACON domain-containing protein [Alistipes sp.]
MRTIKNYLMMGLVAVCAVALLAGCRKDPGTNPNKPNVKVDSEIVLKKESVSASLDGGSYLIEYSIKYNGEGEDPHTGEKITAEAAEEWVNNFNYSVTGVLQFNVDANPSSESRECLVTVKYRYAEDATFVVKQGAKISMGFKLENVTSTYFDYTVDVIPEDKTTPYIVMSASPEYIIASGFETGEDYYEDDVAYFGWLGQFYGESAVQIMQERAKVGDQRGVTVSNGASGVPYTFYCYYIDYESGALLSDVSFFTVETAKPELQDIDFKMDYEIKDGCLVVADVTPVNYDGNYYFDVLHDYQIKDYMDNMDFLTTEARVVEYWWANAVQEMMTELSSDQIIANYTCVGTYADGTLKSHFEFELLANHDYYLFAFAMEEHGLCCSTPKLVKFTTGDVAMSDNEIRVEVQNLTSRTATLNFWPSNDDYYVAGYEEAALWNTYGSNDAERQQYLLTNLSYELCSGNVSAKISKLKPNTEYIAYAFGSRGGKPTTKSIFTQTFTTKSGEDGAVNISFKDLGYYDCAAVAQYPGLEFFGGEAYAGKVVFPYDVEFSSDEHGDFWYDIYNWTGRHESEYYTEEQYLDGLIWSMDTYGGSAAEQSYVPLEIGGVYELVGIVLDTEGNFSSMYREWVRPTYDGCRNPEDFVEWYTLWQENMNDGPELSSLVVNELFREKTDYGMRVSEMTFEKERVQMAADEIFAR